MNNQTITIKVTRKDIKEGQGRSCTNCAISRAISRQLPAMGFEDDSYIYFVPYGGFGSDYEDLGIEIRSYHHETIAKLPADKLSSDICEWAMNFDEWDDMRHMGWRAYEKETGQVYPLRPQPFSFVLNLGDFKREDAE